MSVVYTCVLYIIIKTYDSIKIKYKIKINNNSGIYIIIYYKILIINIL